MSRQISGYLSNSSSLKGQRWAFGEKLEQSKNHLIVAVETVKSKYTPVSFLNTTAFGDSFMIKSQHFDKSDDSNEEKLFRLYTVQKSKYNKKERTYFLKQASILMSSDPNPSIGKLQQLFMSSNQFFLIYKEPQLNGESAPGLFDYFIKQNKPLNICLIRQVCIDLLLTLQSLHSKGIAHLDLSPVNILVTQDFDFEHTGAVDTEKRLQITNFFMSAGFCKKKFSTNKITSFYFMAPERILAELDKDKNSDTNTWVKCDIWSIGVILFMLTFGKAPFTGENNNSIVKSIKKGLQDMGNQDWGQEMGQLIELIQAMLQVDPRERIDAAQALNFDFLTAQSDAKPMKFKV